MTFTIRVEGAQPEEIMRGLIAAQEVFDKARVTPDQAATARFVVEGWDIRKVPEEELAICTVWDEADQAAVQACCANWAERGYRALYRREIMQADRGCDFRFLTALRGEDPKAANGTAAQAPKPT